MGVAYPRGSTFGLPLVFKDKDTPSPFVEVLPADPDGEAQRKALPDHIYMDCMGFGMGCCCLQVWNGVLVAGSLEWFGLFHGCFGMWRCGVVCCGGMHVCGCRQAGWGCVLKYQV